MFDYKLQDNHLFLCDNQNLHFKRSLKIQISSATWLQLLNNSELKYTVLKTPVLAFTPKIHTAPHIAKDLLQHKFQNIPVLIPGHYVILTLLMVNFAFELCHNNTTQSLQKHLDSSCENWEWPRGILYHQINMLLIALCIYPLGDGK